MKTKQPKCAKNKFDSQTLFDYLLVQDLWIILLGTHPDEGGGEPARFLLDIPLPPGVVRHVQNLDDVANIKTELVTLRPHSVPHRICIHQ